MFAKHAFITVKFTRTFHAFPNRFKWPVLSLGPSNLGQRTLLPVPQRPVWALQYS